jgi:hypothetical protein
MSIGQKWSKSEKVKEKLKNDDDLWIKSAIMLDFKLIRGLNNR